MELTKNNIEMYAMKHYTNELCLSKDEFLEDLQRYKLARKLARKIAAGKSENIRLLCNHILCFTNNFQLPAAKNILLFGASDQEKSVMKTVLNYLGFIHEKEMMYIRIDINTAIALKNMDK